MHSVADVRSAGPTGLLCAHSWEEMSADAGSADISSATSVPACLLRVMNGGISLTFARLEVGRFDKRVKFETGRCLHRTTMTEYNRRGNVPLTMIT